MEQTVSWEINSYSSDQEISYFSWNLKVYYWVYKSPQLDPALNQMNPGHILILIV
jgi:hypothetical protein